MREIDKIVKEMLEEHEGGEEFFTHLDEAIRSKAIVEQMIDLASKSYKGCDIIVSGKFGEFFLNYVESTRNYARLTKIIVVNGSLRKGEPITDLSYLKDFIKEEKKFMFIDDSFYSGKTRNAIEKELNKYGGTIVSTIVAYDGSKTKDDTIKSLYRYYK